MEAVAQGFEIPEALKTEHEALHASLKSAIREPGALGETARRVAELLHPHFVKEEEFALPALALLRPLARGEVTSDMEAVLPLTDRLERELPGMLDDHRKIVDALGAFRAAAQAVGRPEYVEFADELVRHAQAEEILQYPAAIVVGRYIKSQMRR